MNMISLFRLQKFFVLIIIFYSFSCTAQNGIVPLESFFTREIERTVSSKDSIKHTGFKPFLKNDFNLGKVTGYSKDSVKYYELIGELVLRDHLVEVRDKDFYLAIDPLFDFSFGSDLADTSSFKDSTNIFNNTRGALIQGEIGSQVSFFSGFYENQSSFPRYLRNYSYNTTIVPGMGRVKNFHHGAFDYNMSFGAVNYAPRKYLNFQIGYGKHFIGHGYRSLLLSDVAFAYPYISGTLLLAHGKLRYNTIYSTLSELERLPIGETPEPLFKRKGGSFHLLSWIPFSRLEVGFFEGTIWQLQDSTGAQRLPWDAYIPLIGLSTSVNGFDAKHNVLTGIDAQFKITDYFSAYGQFALNDPSSKRMGWQVGLNYFNFGARNLDAQVEWNCINNNTYSSRYTLQRYGHFNQPLAVPYGPGGREFVARMNYRYARLLIKAKYNMIRQPGGDAGNLRADPSMPESIDAPARTVSQMDFQVALYLNPKTNMQVFTGYLDRRDGQNAPIPGLHTSVFYFGVRTNIHNRYTDF
ncbi:MAG: hypothetical protein IT223_02465 [Crocinitomicaceae bacterium]|nr:hypothetical protein [Crocinitomicaceae bacterium]